MNEVEYSAVLDTVLDSIGKSSALLLSGNVAEGINPMTIGWCMFGTVWGKSICAVLVRKSRHSHELMENNDYFTVSVPTKGDMRETIALCGSVSGREVNKINTSHIEIASMEDNVILPMCEFNICCRKVFSAQGSLDEMDVGLHTKFYNSNQATIDGDPHTIYFGEILHTYRR